MCYLLADSTLKLHQIGNSFDISKFTLSLNRFSVKKYYHCTKWKQKWVLRQAANLKVTSIWHRSDIEKNYVENSSTFEQSRKSNLECRPFHVDSFLIIDELSTDLRPKFQCQVDGKWTKMFPLRCNCEISQTMFFCLYFIIIIIIIIFIIIIIIIIVIIIIIIIIIIIVIIIIIIIIILILSSRTYFW